MLTYHEIILPNTAKCNLRHIMRSINPYKDEIEAPDLYNQATNNGSSYNIVSEIKDEN